MADGTWQGAAGGYWSTASNWNNGATPPTTLSSVPTGTVKIPVGSSIVLQSNVSVNNLDLSGAGTVTLSGAYTLSVTTTVAFNAGDNLVTSGVTVSGDFGLTFTGSGAATITGGTWNMTGSATLASNQSLNLTNVNFTDSSPITGLGTIYLSGSSLNFTGSTPSAPIYFNTVASGGATSTLIVPAYDTGLELENFGYGDVIHTDSGQTLSLQLQSGSTTVYNIVDNHGGYNSILGTTTLAPGTNSNMFNNSNGNFTYGGAAAAPGCFYAGASLATEDGVIAVEDIVAGTLLKTASGEILPVRWLGYTHVSTLFADPLRVLPIRIKTGALGENLPERDLLVSPDHAMFIGGVLVQAGAMVNGISIVRESNVPETFNYYHVELATHELLLAEGAPAESFIDNVDRFNFANWAEHEALGETAPIEEMHYPRAKSFRQVPMAVRELLDARLQAAQADDFAQAEAA
jgi:hypothetical protein